MTEEKNGPRGIVKLDPGAVATAETVSDMWKGASALSKSNVIPAAFAGNVANCMVALQFAAHLNVPVMTAMRALYVPKQGQVGISTEFLHSELRRKGLIRGPVSYRFEPMDPEQAEPLSEEWKSLICYASVIDAETGEKVVWPFHMRTALANGWAKRSPRSPDRPSNYETMPRDMLSARALSGLIRHYYPEVLAGHLTDVEVQDSLQTEQAAREATVEHVVDLLNDESTPVQEAEPVVVEAKAEKPKSKAKAEQEDSDDGLF